MTTANATARDAMTPSRRTSLVRALHAEWTKLVTVRGWVIALIGAAVVMDVVGLFAAGSADISCGGSGGQTRTGSACRASAPTGPGGEAVTDAFYFVRQPLARDGSITVHMTSLTGRYTTGAVAPGGGQQPATSDGTQPWSKAGIMIKATTAPGSAYAAMMVTGGHGVRMQYDYTHDIAGLSGTLPISSGRWLRLTRAGDTIIGYDSPDGTHWSRVGTARLSGLPTIARVGLFAASPDHTVTTQSFGGSNSTGGPSMATGDFDHVTVSGAVPGSAWSGGAIGGGGGGPAPQLGGSQQFRQRGDQFTVSGSGDIVPIVPGSGAGLIATIQQHLIGGFAGLLVLVVVATMFITAEYRRGLIRTTLVAIPHRGQVLAAKAIVIGAATFAIGLIASVIAVAIGVPLSRDEGEYVLPVPATTEVRVIVGTAALLAIAAILSLAVGALVRRSAVAVAAVIVGIVLPYILGSAAMLPSGAAAWLLRVTPAAGFAIQQSIPHYSQVTASYGPPAYLPLSPWAGFGVLCGYAAVTLTAAFVLLRRRDA